MTSTSAEVSPAAQPPSAVASAQSEEVIRLALVMNGGVSLAVWMGGVTHELSRLLGRTGASVPDVWKEILEAHRDSDGLPIPRRVVVDYVAGTSAGGLNGCLLATSIARGGNLPPLKDLWLDKGSLQLDSLVPKAEDRGSSVLDGQFFHDSIFEVVDRIGLNAENASDMSLLVTSTALAKKVSDPDSFVAEDQGGNKMEVKDHRRVYLFQSASRADDEQSQFTDTATLALAARASASFPAAFAPVRETEELRARRIHQPRDRAYDGPTWLIDGGVLDNAPFEPLLDEMVRLPRSDRGSRWVVYVVPSAIDNSHSGDDSDGSDDDPPSWLKVVKSLWGTKSEVDLRSDVDTLQRLAAESRSVRLRPEEFLVSDAARSVDVQPLLNAYRETRADGFARFLRETNSDIVKLGTREIDSDKAKDLLGFNPLFIPEGLEPARDTRWQWGVTVAQRFLLWLSRDARATDGHPRLVEDLADAEREMNVLAAQVMDLYRVKKFGNRDPRDVANKTATSFAELMGKAWVLMDTAVAGWAEARGFRNDSWQRLMATEVLHNHAEWHVRPAPPPFQVLLVNPGSPSVDAFVLPPEDAQDGDIEKKRADLREIPNNKLYGTRLGHFAGFGARRYREHDWLWGRLDAAACLASALLRDVNRSKRNELRLKLMADIIADEDSTRKALAVETAKAESMDGPRLIADMLKEGEIDLDDLTESLLDMALATEWSSSVDNAADDAIAGLGNLVGVVAKVVSGVTSLTDRVKRTAKHFVERVRALSN